jgi:hypothetical protein
MLAGRAAIVGDTTADAAAGPNHLHHCQRRLQERANASLQAKESVNSVPGLTRMSLPSVEFENRQKLTKVSTYVVNNSDQMVKFYVAQGIGLIA